MASSWVKEKKARTDEEADRFLRPEGVWPYDLRGGSSALGRVCRRRGGDANFWSSSNCSCLAVLTAWLSSCWVPVEWVSSRLMVFTRNPRLEGANFAGSSLSAWSSRPSLELPDELSSGTWNMSCFTFFHGMRPWRNVDLCLDVLVGRLKRHLGTRASAMPERMTRLQETRISSPPTQRPAFSITAWGEVESRRTLIKAIDKSCSSAGRRLVVVSVCKAMHRFTCKG